jgi:hypothetical protein
MDSISFQPLAKLLTYRLSSRLDPSSGTRFETAESIPGYSYRAEARSVVMLFAEG